MKAKIQFILAIIPLLWIGLILWVSREDVDFSEFKESAIDLWRHGL